MMKNKKVILAIISYIICVGLYTTALFTHKMIFLLLGSIFLCVGAFLMISETMKQMK